MSFTIAEFSAQVPTPSRRPKVNEADDLSPNITMTNVYVHTCMHHYRKSLSQLIQAIVHTQSCTIKSLKVYSA